VGPMEAPPWPAGGSRPPCPRSAWRSLRSPLARREGFGPAAGPAWRQRRRVTSSTPKRPPHRVAGQAHLAGDGVQVPATSRWRAAPVSTSCTAASRRPRRRPCPSTTSPYPKNTAAPSGPGLGLRAGPGDAAGQFRATGRSLSWERSARQWVESPMDRSVASRCRQVTHDGGRVVAVKTGTSWFERSTGASAGDEPATRAGRPSCHPGRIDCDRLCAVVPPSVAASARPGHGRTHAHDACDGRARAGHRHHDDVVPERAD